MVYEVFEYANKLDNKAIYYERLKICLEFNIKSKEVKEDWIQTIQMPSAEIEYKMGLHESSIFKFTEKQLTEYKKRLLDKYKFLNNECELLSNKLQELRAETLNNE